MRIQTIFIFSIMILLSACANRVTPTGGTKDIISPKFTGAVPVNLSNNFKATKIELSFDELVLLKDLPAQLVISPLIEPMPEVKAFKNKVIIKFLAPLKENTTYTINFGKAIADVHENNPLENLQYVFSTGEILDSLICSGSVLDAATLFPLKGLTVMIYRNDSMLLRDSLVFNKKPDYFTRTDEQGLFNIRNIAAGNYSIYALDDKNNNYLADDPQGEPFAFNDKIISIPQTDSLLLLSSNSYPQTVQLKNSLRVERGKAILAFNQPTDSIQLLNLSTGKKWPESTEWSLWKDTLTVYMPDTLTDSLNLVVLNHNTAIDTVHLNMGAMEGFKTVAVLNRMHFEIMNSPENNGPATSFVIASSRPIRKINGNVLLYNDSILIAKEEYLLKQDTINTRLFSINYKWTEGQNYKLIFPSGLFIDQYGLTNDTLKFNIHIPTPEATALLNVVVLGETLNSKYLLQLVNDKFDVKRQQVITSAGVYNFSFVAPGVYRIRIVKDENNNGRWDIGSYGKNLQPEKINVSASPIQLRANWEMETEIRVPDYKN